MSHFTVMVIGNEPEEQLAPFSENLETPMYVKENVPEEEKESFLSHYREEKKEDLPFDLMYAKYGDDWNGSAYKLINNVWVETSTYNPNSKWDWYELGGRWSGRFIKLKSGADGQTGRPGTFRNPVGVDAALKGDIDFDLIRNEAETEAATEWDEVNNHFNSIEGLDRNYTSWEKVREEMFPGDIKSARKFYHDQPIVKLFDAFNEKSNRKYAGIFGDGVAPFMVPKETYVKNTGDQSFSTFAVLKDGQWSEKGSMGWFGMSSDKMTQAEWNSNIWELLKTLPDDALISIYDCHI